jgi:hypothetical protein
VPFNILLLPLLGGFIFISLCNRFYWHAQRAEKERLLLYASCAGIICLGFALLIAAIPPFIPCKSNWPCLPTWWRQHVPFRYSGVSTIALLIGATAWWPLNKWVLHERTEWARLIDRQGGPLEKMLYVAMVERKWVMLTLKNGKVYMGQIGAGFTPEKDKTIFLLPLRSGYRDPVRHWVTTTNNYEGVYEKIKQKNPETWVDIIADFGVVIPVADVLTATLYRPDIHDTYFMPETTFPADGWPVMLTAQPVPPPPPSVDIVDTVFRPKA